MVIFNKNQVEIELKKYKIDDKIKVVYPDDVWAKYHFGKAEYNLRMARINFNLNAHPDFMEELEKTKKHDAKFNTHEWVIIMSYYAMFHSVNALLRKIGIKIGKQYAHEVTTNLLLHYFYYTKIIEDELLKIYENAEEKARGLVVSYIFAKEERTKNQYEVNLESQRKNAEKILDDAVNFVSRLKDISKTLSKESVMIKLGKKSL
ncbi:MAG: HEPN domain-containing protein [Candidatus Woesearchaeota archaeon]|nr:HEPN domain-containing protein [Candidatus Woesearchaeota archaeon]